MTASLGLRPEARPYPTRTATATPTPIPIPQPSPDAMSDRPPSTADRALVLQEVTKRDFRLFTEGPESHVLQLCYNRESIDLGSCWGPDQALL